MSGKSTTFRGQLLDLVFFNTPITGIAASPVSPLANLYVALHRTDPGAGDQTTDEIVYGGYTRIALPRDTNTWIRNGNVVSPVADIVFPEVVSGVDAASYWSVGSLASGAGQIFYAGPLSATITIAVQGIPTIGKNSTISES